MSQVHHPAASVKLVSSPSGPKFNGELALRAQYVWVLLASYDNTGNSETYSTDITRTVTTNLSRKTYMEAIQKTSQEGSAGIFLNMEIPVVSHILSIDGEQSAKWASAFWQQHLHQLSSTECINSCSTFQWNFSVAPKAKSDLYRLNFVGPAGIIETDVIAIVPTGTDMKNDNLSIVTRVSQEYSIWKTDLNGGNGGRPFDDGMRHGYIHRLTFRYAHWIDSIKALYDDHETEHGGMGGTGPFHMPVDPKDPIASISVKWLTRDNHDFVVQLVFVTRAGVRSEFGSEDWTRKQVYQVPPGYNLTSLVGRSDTYLDQIQFVFTNQPSEQIR